MQSSAPEIDYGSLVRCHACQQVWTRKKFAEMRGCPECECRMIRVPVTRVTPEIAGAIARGER